MGGYPKITSHLRRCFHEKNHPFWGTCMETSIWWVSDDFAGSDMEWMAMFTRESIIRSILLIKYLQNLAWNPYWFLWFPSECRKKNMSQIQAAAIFGRLRWFAVCHPGTGLCIGWQMDHRSKIQPFKSPSGDFVPFLAIKKLVLSSSASIPTFAIIFSLISPLFSSGFSRLSLRFPQVFPPFHPVFPAFPGRALAMHCSRNSGRRAPEMARKKAFWDSLGFSCGN